ncbi:GntR family transcriptional regulator [Yinghuangia sp. YIM S09857]|uniref:GntR family transcriptional regulator n=1 Tax=Yinghuangia sp. YIM S09857 TaxID=3436929 RepID=UPI003F52C97B
MPAEPSYRRVADDLRRRIRDGDLRPGDPVPSRREISRRYRVGDGSAQRAIRVLRAEGLVTGRQRHRLVVADTPTMRTLTDPDEPWPHTGDEWSDITPAPGSIAARLGIAPGAPVEQHTQELTDAHGRPTHIRVTYQVPGTRSAASSREAVVRARAAEPGEAGVLGVDVGALLLVVEVIHYTTADESADAVDLLLPAAVWTVRLD